MTNHPSSQPGPDAASAPGANRTGAGPAPASPSPLARPFVEPPPAGGGLGRPRVKMLTTEGDLTPAGATYTPPSAAPLPERGSGIQLFLSVLAALLALVFLFLLAQKL